MFQFLKEEKIRWLTPDEALLLVIAVLAALLAGSICWAVIR